MILPRGWVGLLALAAALAGVAIWAGPNLGLAVPAGAAAVVVGGLLFATGWPRTSELRHPRPAPVETPDPTPTVNVRLAFASGALGREDLVLLLDKVERAGPNPTLPVRSADELHALTSRPERDFLAYVADRLGSLEEET